MEKAFDVKFLGEMLKAEGLPLIEEQVLLLEKVLMLWIKESVKMSESKLDDIALPILEAFQPMIEAQISKIDGK